MRKDILIQIHIILRKRNTLSIKEKILINSRIYFTLRYASVVLRTRGEAKRKVYDTKAWSDSSFEIFRFIEKTGGKFHITGMENITKPAARFFSSAII